MRFSKTRTRAALQLRDWQPEGEPRAQVLAVQIDEALARRLTQAGAAVWTFADPAQANLRNLAHVALDLRKRYPHARLLTLGPAQLVAGFQRRYPPLSDGLLDPENPSL